MAWRKVRRNRGQYVYEVKMSDGTTRFVFKKEALRLVPQK